MSDYANQLNIKIAEVARLTFNDIVNDGVNEEIRGSIEIVICVEFLKAVYEAIGQAIKNHEANLAIQVEVNRKMN